MFFVFVSIPDWYKTQELFDRVVSEDSFLIVYCPDKCKTQGMRDKTVDLETIFLSNFWLGILNLNNAKHSKKDKWRINANSVAS